MHGKTGSPSPGCLFHAVEARDDGVAPRGVAVHHDLRVAPGAEDVPFGAELGPETVDAAERLLGARVATPRDVAFLAAHDLSEVELLLGRVHRVETATAFVRERPDHAPVADRALPAEQRRRRGDIARADQRARPDQPELARQFRRRRRAELRTVGELDPTLAPFTRVVLRAHKELPASGVVEGPVPLAADLDGVRTAVRTVADAVGDPEAGARYDQLTTAQNM